ncbi:hypothetical protein EV1_014144 [Malus domestica]
MPKAPKRADSRHYGDLPITEIHRGTERTPTHNIVWNLDRFIEGNPWTIFFSNLSFAHAPNQANEVSDITVVDMPPGTGDAHITIPLEAGIRKGSDNGVPIVISAPDDSDVSIAYVDVAWKVGDRLKKKEQSRSHISL